MEESTKKLPRRKPLFPQKKTNADCEPKVEKKEEMKSNFQARRCILNIKIYKNVVSLAAALVKQEKKRFQRKVNRIKYLSSDEDDCDDIKPRTTPEKPKPKEMSDAKKREARIREMFSEKTCFPHI